jgi:CoA:oxalate CoA-transferase
MAQRLAHRDELKQLIESALSTTAAAEWVPIISRAGIPCGPILDYTHAFTTVQVSALELVHHVRRRDGSELPLVRGPLSLDGEASEIVSPPPLLGEHTAEILREIGYSDDDIERLDKNGRLGLDKETA